MTSLEIIVFFLYAWAWSGFVPEGRDAWFLTSTAMTLWAGLSVLARVTR